MVIAMTPWASDGIMRVATRIDNRWVVKVSLFGDSALSKFFPLAEDDETLLKILELHNEVTVYMRSTQTHDWDPANTFGSKPAQATKEAEK